MSEKTTLPSFRISRVALGRRLASAILKIREAELSPETFAATMNAVFNSCMTGESVPAPDGDIDRVILFSEQAEIEKSERRSIAARKAAERRRKMRENGGMENENEKTETVMPETVKCEAGNNEVGNNETGKNEAGKDEVGKNVPEKEEGVSNNESGAKKRRRKRRRRNKRSHFSGTEREAMNPEIMPMTSTTSTVTSMSDTSNRHG